MSQNTSNLPAIGKTRVAKWLQYGHPGRRFRTRRSQRQRPAGRKPLATRASIDGSTHRTGTQLRKATAPHRRIRPRTHKRERLDGSGRAAPHGESNHLQLWTASSSPGTLSNLPFYDGSATRSSSRIWRAFWFRPAASRHRDVTVDRCTEQVSMERPAPVPRFLLVVGRSTLARTEPHTEGAGRHEQCDAGAGCYPRRVGCA
jgi:hypothetical protein